MANERVYRINGETFAYGSKAEQVAAIVRANAAEAEALEKVANGKSKRAPMAAKLLEQSRINNERLLVQLRQGEAIEMPIL